MKTILLTIALGTTALLSNAQSPISIYEAPSSGNKMNRFEHDDNALYVVRDSSVDKIDAVTNVVTKLFDKPWGASVNANGKAIFSNGKAIIGQYITGSPYKYKYWVYNGSSFDTLFTIIGGQIDDNWVVDGNVCYFSVNKQIYKSDFTKAGTAVIANVAANTLLINMKLFNHDLYFFNTTSSVSNSVFKKYSGNTLTIIDSSFTVFGNFKTHIYNNELFYSLYETTSAPSYNSYIKKINTAGTTTTLYSDNSATAMQNIGFMGGVGTTLFMYGTNGSSSTTITEFLYNINTSTGGTPTKMQSSTGSFINLQSANVFKQGTSIVYFDVYIHFATNSDRELWQSDGTMAGTHAVTPSVTPNITSATGFGVTNLEQWFIQGVTCDDKLYSIMSYVDLWQEDGTASKITVANYQTFGSLAKCAGSVFMTAQNATTYKPQIMKLNCTATNAINDITTNNTIKIYPNPSNGTFTILSNNIGETLTITDVAGKKVYSTILTSVTQQINAELNAGIYFITVANSKTQKLIVE